MNYVAHFLVQLACGIVLCGPEAYAFKGLNAFYSLHIGALPGESLPKELLLIRSLPANKGTDTWVMKCQSHVILRVDQAVRPPLPVWLRAICDRSECLAVTVSPTQEDVLVRLAAGNCSMTLQTSHTTTTIHLEEDDFHNRAADNDVRQLSWVADALEEHGALAQDYYADWKASFAGSTVLLNQTLDVVLDDMVDSLDSGCMAAWPPAKSMRSIVETLYAQPSLNGDPLFALRALLQNPDLRPRPQENAMRDHTAQFRSGLVRSTVAAVLSGVLHPPDVDVLPLDENFIEMGHQQRLRKRAWQKHPDASMQQLAAMLLEVHAKTVSLLEAGVTSKEVFACIVDNIMNMAPEIILQIIIQLVRDLIVDLLGMAMVLVMPAILVPNSGAYFICRRIPISVGHFVASAGAVGISAPNPKLSVPVKGPHPAPCACTTAQGNSYAPQAFLQGDGSFHGDCDCSDVRFAGRSAGAVSAGVTADMNEWVHASAYASAQSSGGPVSHVLPKVKEQIDNGLKAVAFPRLFDALTSKLKPSLTFVTEASIHRGVSRLLIKHLTKELGVGIFTKTSGRVSHPLADAVSESMIELLSPALASSLSVSLVHSISHHPAQDYMCLYCQKSLPANFASEHDTNATYCAACAQHLAHHAVLDVQIRQTLAMYLDLNRHRLD